jgi:type IV pilus assembly protein PilM
MLPNWRAQVQPIGLDIGHDSIRMMQLEVTGHVVSVRASAFEALPDEARISPEARQAAAAEIVRRMFRQHSFVGREVVVALPSEMVHVKNLRLPQMPVAEMASAVQFEAQSVLPFPMDNVCVQFIAAGEVRQGGDVRQEVIVFAAAADAIEQYVERLHRSGVLVQSVDVEACALYRGVERFLRRREDEQEVHVVVDAGYSRTQVLIGRGREISFYKPVEIGGQQFQEAVSRKLGITMDEAAALRRRLRERSAAGESGHDPVRQAVFDATRSLMEALAREVALCLRYHSVTFRGFRPTRVRLAGGEGGDPHLQMILNHALTIPAEVARPLANVDVRRLDGRIRTQPLGEWSVATGLGLKLAKGPFGPHPARVALPAAGARAVEVDLNRLADVPAEAASAPMDVARQPQGEALHA